MELTITTPSATVLRRRPAPHAAPLTRRRTAACAVFALGLLLMAISGIVTYVLVTSPPPT